MAVVGKLDSLSGLFSKTQELENLYTYLKQICDPKHPLVKLYCKGRLAPCLKSLGAGCARLRSSIALS